MKKYEFRAAVTFDADGRAEIHTVDGNPDELFSPTELGIAHGLVARSVRQLSVSCIKHMDTIGESVQYVRGLQFGVSDPAEEETIKTTLKEEGR